MRHEIIRAQSDRTHQFLMKRLHGARAQDGIRRSQVNQVIIMDDQRPKPELFAPRAKPSSLSLRNPHPSAIPHSRTRRKNLQGVRAQPMRDLERTADIPCYRRVYSYADAAVFPRGNFGGRWCFRAVLVGGVEG